MRDRDRQTAEHFGILSKVESFEKELLGIDGIVSDTLGDGIDFDLSCWLSEEDRIEDYGEHFYIVLRCDVTWPNPNDFKEVTT